MIYELWIVAAHSRTEHSIGRFIDGSTSSRRLIYMHTNYIIISIFIYSPNGILPPEAVLRHRTSGNGSPPTRHWNVTELPTTVVWFCGPRIKNGLTVTIYGNSLECTPGEIYIEYIHKIGFDGMLKEWKGMQRHDEKFDHFQTYCSTVCRQYKATIRNDCSLKLTCLHVVQASTISAWPMMMILKFPFTENWANLQQINCPVITCVCVNVKLCITNAPSMLARLPPPTISPANSIVSCEMIIRNCRKWSYHELWVMQQLIRVHQPHSVQHTDSGRHPIGEHLVLPSFHRPQCEHCERTSTRKSM